MISHNRQLPINHLHDLHDPDVMMAEGIVEDEVGVACCDAEGVVLSIGVVGTSTPLPR